MKKIILIVILGSFFTMTQAQSIYCYQTTTPKETLSNAEKNSLLKMADEEKLAHDVYLKLSETYNLPVFRNIAKAENRHHSVVLSMLKKYDIDYVDKGIGKFNNSDYDKLYEKLLEKGKTSLVDALKVGAEIEDLDIYDLDNAINNEIDNNDITAVYENIRQGSYHHLKAFTNILKRYNESYTPQYISKSRFNEITTTSK